MVFFAEANPKDNNTTTLTKANRGTTEALVINRKSPEEFSLTTSMATGRTTRRYKQTQLTQIKIQQVQETAPNKDAIIAKRREDAILKGMSLCERIIAGTLAYENINAERDRINEMFLEQDALASKREELNALELVAAALPQRKEAKGKEKPAAKETPAAKR